MAKTATTNQYKLNQKQKEHLRNLSEKKTSSSGERSSIKSRTQRSMPIKKGREAILSKKVNSSNGGASRQSIGGTISGPSTIVNRGKQADSR